WSTHRLNELADAGDFEAITRRINGGLNGQDDRLALYDQSLKVLV
ncbi:glycoside hydrolase family 19 protein, partial [Pseudomonas sp. C2L12B]|nr:glycoside hydrolase family 19 protein [Pseudomonas typographi]